MNNNKREDIFPEDVPNERTYISKFKKVLYITDSHLIKYW